MGKFLKTQGTKIVSGSGKPLRLRGVNLGGWLMMEAYILYAPNYPEHKFKKEFSAALGATALQSFQQAFRANFIREKDLKNIAAMGMNCVRVPFNCRLVETKPYQYDLAGVAFLDRVIKWARKYKLRAILDLHAAPGAQNHDWHGDSCGRAQLWSKKPNRDRTLALWEFIADRYKNEEYVAGYDLLNEPVLSNTKLLNQFYKNIIKRIRSVDKNHILFIEGNNWATNVDCLEEYDDDNYALSIHNYEPIDLTFNFVPGLTYPLKSPQGRWNKGVTRKHLLKYKKISQKRGVPVFVGESGVNARSGHNGEDRWLADTIKCYNEYGFHWTYWTYKAVKNFVFPDGVYSYTKNPPWVNRLGPLTGWDTYKQHWKKHQKQMAHSWRTEQFEPNKEIIKVLKDGVR